MRNLSVALIIALVTVACSDSGPVTQTKEITKTQDVKEAPAAPAKLPTSAERFGTEHAHTSGMPGAAPATPGAMGGGQAVSLDWTAPEGWEQAAAAPMRLVTFKVTGVPEAECYVSTAGGGLEANANRWRKQLGQADYTADEFAKLPRVPVLGQQAAIVEIEGAYAGMGGGEKKEGYKLLGAILDYQGTGVFVKMTGPAAALDKEKAHFDAFLASLKPGAAKPEAQVAAGAELPAGHPATPATGQLPAGHPTTPDTGQLPAGHPTAGEVGGMTDGASVAPFTWTAPDSWKKAADRPMRVATYTGGANAKSECVISMLSGPAGGLDANINRWRGQLGQTPLQSADIAALPKVKVLGKDSPLVEITGPYTGMDGAEQPGYMLLGAVSEVPGSTVFIKMIGPEAEVKAEKEHFIAFCQSLK
ncbi:MAG: hypothetical protein HZB26_14655 [Candidatus Hydrogenedentes bacterium]|nr:hypothetical protein [Candidatus Hydrogenedentota bacterium]